MPPLSLRQVVEKTRQAREELVSFRQQQGQDSGRPAAASPAAERTRRRQQAKQGERLQLAAADNITQLRLACIHPQVWGWG